MNEFNNININNLIILPRVSILHVYSYSIHIGQSLILIEFTRKMHTNKYFINKLIY